MISQFDLLVHNDIFHVNSDMNDTFHIIFDRIIYSTIIFKKEKKRVRK